MWAAACLAAALTAAAPAQDSDRPGIVDLSGPWHLETGGDGTGDGDWREVSLPAASSDLTGGRIRLRRELSLGEGWRRRLAPSGLAVLIGGPAVGHCRLAAGGQAIGSWSGPTPGVPRRIDRVFGIPSSAVGDDGRVVLTLDWQRQGWAVTRSLGRRARIGADWLFGDRTRLETEAELRRLEALNGDLPLLVLALLYAAIGAYHLQLFRRDRRCREYLWFGLTAIVVALHTLQFSHGFAVASAAAPWLRRLYLATGAVMFATSIQFFWPFLSRPIDRWLKRYQLSCLVLASLAMAVPTSLWTPWLETVCRAWGIPFLVAAAIVLAHELRRGNPEARTIAIGGIAIAVVGLAEVAFQALGLGTTFPVSSYAFAVFAVSMAFSLSNRFSRVHDDLDLLRLQLEDMVDDRAEELSSANQRLRSQISERELAQEAMHMLERAVEQSIDGILVADLEENILFVNEAWASLHRRETFEIFGRRLDLFHSVEQLDQVRPALAQVRQEGSWEGEIGHRTKDGSVFPTWMSITLLRDPAGEPVGFVMVARDISERRREEEERQRMEARIQEAEKLRSLADLAGGIAHDYNNLLTGVLGNSSLALRELPAGSPAREKLMKIGSAAERAAELTAQLLAYAGAEALVLKRVVLDQLVVESRADLVRAAGEARLEIELGGGAAEIEVDAAQVRHAMQNLVANAAAASRSRRVTGEAADEAVITLVTGEVVADREYLAGAYLDEDLAAGDFVSLRVSDRGRDLEADRQRIFDPFASTQGSVGGLGLATVLSTARVHRGTVKVTSRPEGGSTFELLFPVAGEKAATRRAVARPGGKWRGSGTVMVVDDEYIMREVSRSILEQSGFEVLATGEGHEALELYRRHMSSIRLILLDRTMPSMPGEVVLERILSLNPDARIVLMSGYRSDETVRELIAKGLAEFLPKPFRPEELVDKVRGVIG